jgi:hypothetical protein
MKACVFAMVVLFASAARADDGFRCPDTRRLIALHDSTLMVRKKCREPDDATRYSETRRTRRLVRQYVKGAWVESWVDDEITVQVEKWLYDFGRHDFMRLLYFENDLLTKVTSEGYGGK